MIGKLINQTERESHRLIIEKINPLIRNKNFSVMSYSINPIYGQLEVILDNEITNKRIVFSIQSNKEVDVYAYDELDAPIAVKQFTVKQKNISSSKRINEIILFAIEK